MSRTLIKIDDELIERVMRSYRLRTKREAVHFALTELDNNSMTIEEQLGMKGVGWDGDLDEMRGGVPTEERVTAKVSGDSG